MDLSTCTKTLQFKELNDFDDGIESFLDYLHNIFCDFFFKNKITYNGKRIIVSKEKESDGRLERFWHVISYQEDYTNRESRFPDTARCNAIHFIPHLTGKCIEVEKCNNILITERNEKNKNKVYVWCTNKNIMVILEEKKNIYRFITCFIVRGAKNKKKYLDRYEEYKKNRDG